MSSRLTTPSGGGRDTYSQSTDGDRRAWSVNSATLPTTVLEETNTVRFTYLGRHAVWQAVETLDLNAGDEILVPSYNCGSEIDPLVERGLRIVPYRVLESTRIDHAHLEGCISPRTRAVYVTHYFGFPQPLKEILQLCQRRGLALVEDCALALFSRDGDTPLGALGDVAVFSFRKTLPLLDGGALAVNHASLSVTTKRETPSLTHELKSVAFLLRRRLRRAVPLLWATGCRAARVFHASVTGALGALGKSGGRPALNVYIDGAQRPGLRSVDRYSHRMSRWTMSSVSRRALRRASTSDVVVRRRRNYAQLLEALRGENEVEPLFPELRDGVCPIVFPVVVNRRAEVCAYLNRRGIDAIEWWAGYHGEIDWRQFPEAAYLKDHVMGLSVDQSLSHKDMAYTAECVRSALQCISVSAQR